jgi:hypothetical protein
MTRLTERATESRAVLENLGNLGEFVGAIGVVISLVYLGRQLVQNTQSVRAASFNSMVQNSIRLSEHAFRDSEFAAFLARAERDPESLSDEERVRWDSYQNAVWRHFGNLQYAHRVGTLDSQMWAAYKATLKDHLETESWALWFLDHRELFSAALGQQVDEALAEIAREATPPVPSNPRSDVRSST